MTETLIDLLRHGEPEGGRMFRGSQDDPLTNAGWEQMRKALENIHWDKRADPATHHYYPLPWSKVISSPLRRCADFGKELALGSGLDFEIKNDYREIGFGKWEGMTPEAIMDTYPGQLEAFWQDPIRNASPNGERVEDFRDRIATIWMQTITENQGNPLLITCHGGTIRMIIALVLGMPLSSIWRIAVPFANITRIKVTQFADGTQSQMLLSHQAQWRPH
jgi:broad specificity phosphatase PhoE